jgi:Integrase core domain
MNEKNPEEIAYRRKAFKLFDQGRAVAQIRRLIPRSGSWVYKWKRRFAQQRWHALDSLPKAPHSSSHQYPQSTVALVLRLRQQFARSSVGLIGARAIRHEVRRRRLLRVVPSLVTINRWLKQAGLIPTASLPGANSYYPQPHLPADCVLLSCDWISRYLEGGEKAYALHTIDAQTHALCQTLSPDKTTEALLLHILQAFTELGLPDFLQIDNDGAFTNLGKNQRVFGRFLRALLYLGVEPIFIPPGEPKRNSLVEGVNHLWAQSFFAKAHFTSVAHLQRQSPKFLAWYDTYAPPRLGELSVAEAKRGVKRRKLTGRERRSLPDPLPLTAGRIHFIRRVDQRGEIRLLNESWKVSKRLVGEYVWATVDLTAQHLRISYRKSARAQTKRIKQYDYGVAEPVKPLLPQYRRRARRVPVVGLI